jgi:hypothetical protein
MEVTVEKVINQYGETVSTKILKISPSSGRMRKHVKSLRRPTKRVSLIRRSFRKFCPP